MVSLSLPKAGKMRKKLESCSEGGMTLSDKTSNRFTLLQEANVSLQKENEWLKNELIGQIESVAIHKDIFKNENKILKLQNRLLEIKYASELNKHQLELEKLRNSFSVNKLQVLAAPPPSIKPAPPDRVFPTIPIGGEPWGIDNYGKTGDVSKPYFSPHASSGLNSGNTSRVEVGIGSALVSSDIASTSLANGNLAAFVPTRLVIPSPKLNVLPPCRPPTKAESSPETRKRWSVVGTSSPIKTESAPRPKTSKSPEASLQISPRKKRKLGTDQSPVKDQNPSKKAPTSPQEKCEIEEKIQKVDKIAKTRAATKTRGVNSGEASEILANLALSFEEPGLTSKTNSGIVKANKSKKRKKNGNSMVDKKARKKPKQAKASGVCTTNQEGQHEESTSQSKNDNAGRLKLSELKQNSANISAANLNTKEAAGKNIAVCGSGIQSPKKKEAIEESNNVKLNPSVSAASDSVVIPKGLPPPNKVFPKSAVHSVGLLNSKPSAAFCVSGGPLKPPTADTIKPSPEPGKPIVSALPTIQHGKVQKPPTKPFSSSFNVVPKTGARPFIPAIATKTGPGLLATRKSKKKQPPPAQKKKKPCYHTAIRPKKVIMSSPQIC